MPADLSMFVCRVTRNPNRIVELETIVREFLREVDAKLGALESLRQRVAA